MGKHTYLIADICLVVFTAFVAGLLAIGIGLLIYVTCF